MKHWFLCGYHCRPTTFLLLPLFYVYDKAAFHSPNRTHVTSFAFGVGIVSIYATINGVLRSYFGVRDSNGGFRSTIRLFINQKAAENAQLCFRLYHVLMCECEESFWFCSLTRFLVLYLPHYPSEFLNYQTGCIKRDRAFRTMHSGNFLDLGPPTVTNSPRTAPSVP